jgi:hypothetical protein
MRSRQCRTSHQHKQKRQIKLISKTEYPRVRIQISLEFEKKGIISASGAAAHYNALSVETRFNVNVNLSSVLFLV